MSNPINIIGLGIEMPPFLSPNARELIRSADVLIGSKRLLANINDCSGQKIIINRNIPEIMQRIQNRDDKKYVVLTSGDPGFHSFAGSIMKRFPDEEIRITPHVNSLQYAFSRIQHPWHQAKFVSAHQHPITEIVTTVQQEQMVGILTDQQNTPGSLASIFLENGIEDCRAIVAENLGMENECIIDSTLNRIACQTYASLNVLLIIKNEGWETSPVFINRPDSDYHHRNGLITKRDIRALSITRLQIRQNDVIWDIGAGSGAVSIEMAHLAAKGKVYSIEKDPENLKIIEKNRQKFSSLNLEIIAGEASQMLSELPSPGNVFIGGTGGNLEEILKLIHQKSSKGTRVVANFTTLENLQTAKNGMQNLGWNPEFIQANIAHSKTIGNLTRLEPLNPIFILKGVRP